MTAKHDAARRVKPLVGHVGGHKATDCSACLALAVAAYNLGKEDEIDSRRAEVDHETRTQD